jgi:molybdopterin-biosynthesis enzyme MoeA-like protein
MSQSVTACVIVIGNEILSGRTQDINLNHIATTLGGWGIQVHHARVIPDDEDIIVNTINEVRGSYDYVFTTGGIGPDPRRHHGGVHRQGLWCSHRPTPRH